MASDGTPSLKNLEIIPLADIDSDAERFRITTRSDVDDLCASISKLDLLNPPRLLPADSRFMIVSGFRRVAACRRLGWDRLPAVVLPSDVSHYRCAGTAVGDNSSQRQLNLIEAGRSLLLLERWAPDRRIPPEDADALKLPRHPGVTAKLKDLCRLPAAVQQGVIEGWIAFAMAVELGRLEPALAVDLAAVFRELKIGLNRQREIATLIMEIAQREALAARGVMQDPQLTAVLQAAELDRSQKARQVRQRLRQRRFPSLHTAEDNFRRLRQDLKLGENMHLTAPPDFEGIGLTLSLVIEKTEDIARVRAKLDALASHPGLKRMLDGKQSLFAPTSADGRVGPAAPP
jgi:ParB family chromosome partitioning protein